VTVRSAVTKTPSPDALILTVDCSVAVLFAQVATAVTLASAPASSVAGPLALATVGRLSVVRAVTRTVMSSGFWNRFVSVSRTTSLLWLPVTDTGDC